MHRKKILVFGGTGFLGSRVKQTLQPEFAVIAPTRSECDLACESSIQRQVQLTRPDVILNCAGLVGGIGANAKYPSLFFEQNILQNFNIIDTLLSLCFQGVFVNIFPSCFYPSNLNRDLEEDDLYTGPFETTNLGYAVAKATTATRLKLLRDAGELYSVGVVLSNLYGPKPDNAKGEYNHFITDLCVKVKSAQSKEEQEIILWGDGSPIRDFFFVSDAADALRTICRSTSHEHFLYNVGPGKGYSVSEIAEKLLSLEAPHLRIHWDHSKPNGMSRKVLCVDRFRSEFGSIKLTSLDTGLKSTFESSKLGI
jgi:GDP-L-fucose synthase